MGSRLMRVKNILIYICGFTRGGCQIILDKAWKCFCIYGTVDLLKGTTQQITDDWFLPPCAKICLSAWLPYHCKRDQHQYCRLLGEGETLFRSMRRGKWSFKYISRGHYCICMYFFLLLYWLRSLTLFIFVLGKNKGVIHHQCAGIPHFAFVWNCLSKWLKGLYRLQGLSSAGIAVLCWHHLKIWSYLTSIFVCVFWLDIS